VTLDLVSPSRVWSGERARREASRVFASLGSVFCRLGLRLSTGGFGAGPSLPQAADALDPIDADASRVGRGVALADAVLLLCHCVFVTLFVSCAR